MNLEHLTRIYNELYNRIFVLQNASTAEREQLVQAEGQTNAGQSPVGIGHIFIPNVAAHYLEDTIANREEWEGSVAQILL